MDNPEGAILSVESGPSNILYRIEKANYQIVHVKVLNPEVIPEDKRIYGPSAISELSKLEEWNDDSWKTLEVYQDEKGIWCEKDISPPTVPKEYLLDYPIHDISELTVIHHTKSRTSEVAYNNRQTVFLKIVRFPHKLQYVT
uniref:Uncharacterized protein n=1 Tax=Bionectria ochroleuca TaxID=29856 RepID=A0A8H7K507_BIOOC